MRDLALGFDSSGTWCAAALLKGDQVLAQAHEDMAKGQAERLLPMVQELLDRTGSDWPDVGVIGVGVGPGNFTGIRVAVAAARGLALALDVPAIGISVTEAAACGLPRPCRVAVPARGDQVIWQDFPDGQVAQSDRPLPVGPAELPPTMPLAQAIARLAWDRRDGDQPRPAPLYLRPADAAPARDKGPVMLAE